MRKKSGILTLIPTPIDDNSSLNPDTFEKLDKASKSTNAIIVVEDHKPCRRRWIKWGLDRESIESFVCLNEHTVKENTQKLIEQLKQGKNVFLMSDGGLPAFCDPGRELVEQCHQDNIKVTATSFCNSFSLAIALSGFNHRSFQFYGFIPKKGKERVDLLKEILKQKQVTVLNDAPYRLKSLLEQLLELSHQNHEFFLALDLNMDTEQLFRGSLKSIFSQVIDFKREFVLLISPNNS